MNIDIVIPAYNEEKRLGKTLSAYRAGLPEPGVRFFIALDQCTDRTADIVRSHQEVDPRVQLLEFPKLGKGGVLMEGFRHTSASLVGFVDADCATPPAEMRRLAEVAEHTDGAIASRYHSTSVLPVKRPAFRNALTSGGNTIIKRLFRLGYRDTQCGAKVLQGSVVRAVLPLLTARDWLFDVDLLYTARKLGYDIKEVPTLWVDQAGSKVKKSDTGRTLASALHLWVHHKIMPVNKPAA